MDPLTKAKRLLRIKPRPNITRLFSNIETLWDITNKVMAKPNLITVADVEALQNVLLTINSLVILERNDENDKMQNV